MNTQTLFVYVTAPNQEIAKKIAHVLVGERLVGCANIIPGIESWFQWEGKMQIEQEFAIIMKTTEANLDAVNKRIFEMHSYQNPCVVALPIVGGNPTFIDWIKSETKK